MKNGSTLFNQAPRLNKALIVVSCFFLLGTLSAAAQTKTTSPEPTSIFFNPLFMGLLAVIVILLAVIMVFAKLVKTAAYHKVKQDQEKEKTGGAASKIAMLLLLTAGLSNPLLAQTQTSVAPVAAATYGGLSAFTLFFLLFIIAFEIAIIWLLYGFAMKLLGLQERKLAMAAAKQQLKASKKQRSLLEKINASVDIEKEADILLDHNYDGIQELDNNLPPWWKYGFYLTIVFSIVYLIHFHVTRTGKLQLGEYEEQLAQGKRDAEEYRKKAANLVDENNATVLSDQSSLASGKSVYMDNCAACHGRAGEGGVGPNLTDDYWLHSGSIQAIFKTIKYGYPEKGMKAWQQDLGAKQIHEVSSFIKSLRGSNPANAKEKQGELYNEETQVIAADSLQLVSKEK